MNRLELQMPSSNRHKVGMALLDLAREILQEEEGNTEATYTVTAKVPSPCVIKPTTVVKRDTSVKGIANTKASEEAYSLAMADSLEEGLTLSELASALSAEDMADITSKTTALGLLLTDIVGIPTKDGIKVQAINKDIGLYQGDYIKKHRKRKTDRELAVLGGDVDQEIIHLYTEGNTVKSIQKELSKSAGYIYSVLNNNKVPKRNKPGDSSVENKLKAKLEDPVYVNNVISDYEEGIPLEVIYSKYKLYKNALYYILDLYNVPRRINK